MLEISELKIFTTVAYHRSFTKAAKERSVTTSALSHTIKALEKKLGVRLFNRTTRAVTLTEAGTALLETLEPALKAIDLAIDNLNSFRSSTLGTLRLNAPRPAGKLVVKRLLSGFMKLNPDIHVELVTSDRLVDIVEGGFDAGVRYADAVPLDMVTIPILPTQRFALVASPELLKAHTVPCHPQELATLPCILRRFPSGQLYDWEFTNGQEEVIVRTAGRISMDDDEMMVQAALEGLGFLLTYEEFTHDHVESGRLIRLLDEWCQPFPGFVLYYPSRKHASAALRSFIDWCFVVRKSDEMISEGKR